MSNSIPRETQSSPSPSGGNLRDHQQQQQHHHISHGRGPIMTDSDDSDVESADETDLLLPAGSSGGIGNDNSSSNNGSATDSPSKYHLKKLRKRRSGIARVCGSKRARLLNGILCIVLVVILAIVFISFATMHVFFGMIIHDQMPSSHQLSKSAPEALTVNWNNVSLLGVHEKGINIGVNAQAGIDVSRVLGWQYDQKKSKGIEASLIRWAVKVVKTVTIKPHSPILVSSPDSHHAFISIDPPESLTLPLNVGNNDNLKDIQLTIPVTVLDPQVLAPFMNRTLSSRMLSFSLSTDNIDIYPGKFGKPFHVDHFEQKVSVDLPHLPPLNKTHENLYKIKSYEFYPIKLKNGKETLGWRMNSTVYNPIASLDYLPDIKFNLPRLSFGLNGLIDKNDDKNDNDNNNGGADSISLGEAITPPIELSTHKKVYNNISVNGYIDGIDSDNNVLSTIVNRFVQGQSNTLMIKPLIKEWDNSDLADFIKQAAKDIKVYVSVPGTNDKNKELLDHVKIHDMKIQPSPDGFIRCSGTVMGQVSLPREMASLEKILSIEAVRPDVFVYDGTPKPSKPAKTYPPDPLPANAFARLRTKQDVEAKTEHHWDPSQGKNVTIISAQFSNVPLELIEERDSVFRKYLGKIMLHDNIETGIRGVSDAKAQIQQSLGIKLKHLNVEGTFYV